MPLRIAASILLFISIVACPALVTLALGLLCLTYFKRFYELIPLFFLADVLYGVAIPRFFYIPYAMTILAVVLVLLAQFLHTQAFRETPRY